MLEVMNDARKRTVAIGNYLRKLEHQVQAQKLERKPANNNLKNCKSRCILTLRLQETM